MESSIKGSWIHHCKSYSISSDNILSAELYKSDGTITRISKPIIPDFSYKNVDGELEIEEYNNTIFVKLGNQLGNCLRILSSCCIIAKYYNMHVYINMSVSQLWPKELDILKTIFPHLCKYVNENTYESLPYYKYISDAKFFGTNYHVINEGRFVKPAGLNNISIVSNIYNIVPGDMSDAEFAREKIQFYRSLSYPDFLINAVNRFAQTHNLSHCIAFHIRYTDNLTDTQKSKYFNTQLHVFIERLRKYLNESERIVVFSDNQDVLRQVREISPAILFTDKIEFPHFQNLYEMMLLSRSKRIVGSSSSTFSYEAAFLQGTDIELYEDLLWKTYELSVYR